MQGEVFIRLGRELPRSAFVAQHAHPFLVFGHLHDDGDDWDVEFDTGEIEVDRLRRQAADEPVGRRSYGRSSGYPAATGPAAGVRDLGGAYRLSDRAATDDLRRTAVVRIGLGSTLSLASSLQTTRGQRTTDPQFSGVLGVVKSDRNPYAGRISLGRATTCDIVVPTLHVSKLHAHFLRGDDGSWELRDAESTNGTFVNNRRAAPGVHVVIRIGDTLGFGSVQARLVDAAGLFELVNRR